MAKKAKIEEKKTNTKTKKDVNAKIKATKDLKEKNEKIKEVNSKEISNNDVIVKDNTKRNKIIKTVIYSLVALLIIGAFIYSIIESSGRENNFNTISFAKASELINDDEVNIIYWASPNCGYCTQFTPIVKEVSIEKGVTFNYLNAAEISNEDYATLMGLVGSFDETYNTNGLGTPSLILVKEGKVVDISVGAQSKADLVSYLTTQGFIK